MRAWLSFSAGLVVSLFALQAAATSNGAGLTGKKDCKPCHTGGDAPTVKIDGPDSLKAGEEGSYTFTVTTGAAKGSGNILVDVGTLSAVENLQAQGKELTHTQGGVAPAGGEAVFKFKVKAPSSGSKLTISAAGLASDGTNTTGDGDAATTKSVTISGGGAASGDDDDDTSSKSSSSSSKNTKSRGDDDDEDDTSTGIPNSGCSAASTRADTTSALVAFALALLVLKSSKKKPRKS